MEEQWQCDEFCVHNHILEKMQQKKIDEEKSQRTAELFKVLGDNTRVKILYYLLQEELCVCDLTVLVGSSQSAVSHQLRVLRNLRIVQGRKEGKQVFYSICNEHVRQLLWEALAL
ncbi:MAG: ArsR/SmtB family transcription factor [Peptococcaceae bacterium]